MRKESTRWLVFAVVALVPFGLIVAPIASFIVLSLFRAEKSVIIREATLDNYVNFFSNWTYAGTYLGTLALCFQVTAVSVILSATRSPGSSGNREDHGATCCSSLPSYRSS